MIQIERSDCSVTPILAKKQSHSECPKLDCDSEVFILIQRFPQVMRLSDFGNVMIWSEVIFSSVRIDLLAGGYFSSAVLRERERYNV